MPEDLTEAQARAILIALHMDPGSITVVPRDQWPPDTWAPWSPVDGEQVLVKTWRIVQRAARQRARSGRWYVEIMRRPGEWPEPTDSGGAYLPKSEEPDPDRLREEQEERRRVDKEFSSNVDD